VGAGFRIGNRGPRPARNTGRLLNRARGLVRVGQGGVMSVPRSKAADDEFSGAHWAQLAMAGIPDQRAGGNWRWGGGRISGISVIAGGSGTTGYLKLTPYFFEVTPLEVDVLESEGRIMRHRVFGTIVEPPGP